MEAVNPTTNVCFFADNVSFVTIFLYARASHPIVASYFYNTMFGSMSICCSGRLLSWQQLTDPSSQWGAHAGMGRLWLASVWWTKTLLSANCTTNSVNCVQHFRGRWILHGTNFGHISKMTGGDPAVDFISRLYHLAQAEKLTPQFV